MVRKKNTNDSESALELLVSAEEATSKLSDRINRVIKIKQIQINTEQALESAENSYDKWHDYNTELLKRLFTTEKLSTEYCHWQGFGPITMLEPTLREKIDTFHKEIDEKVHRLDSIIERLELIPLSENAQQIESESSDLNLRDKNKIFIVHGQDNEAKLEVARFIEKIGFESIILHEQVSGSRTIIEKIEDYSDVGFGVVIYTPCDVGAKSSDIKNLQGRARQNVVFEHGFLIGKLGRSNVCSLVKGKLETPNDISGIVYTSMDPANWQLELAKELRAAGYLIDMNKVL